MPLELIRLDDGLQSVTVRLLSQQGDYYEAEIAIRSDFVNASVRSGFDAGDIEEWGSLPDVVEEVDDGTRTTRVPLGAPSRGAHGVRQVAERVAHFFLASLGVCLIVIAICECRRMRVATFGCTSSATRREVQVCRVFRRGIDRSPASCRLPSKGSAQKPLHVAAADGRGGGRLW
ncbi:DUF5959 family protein [Streptomyces sp. SLBN-118]|uniref:DUF5959 family protein n=1 Tax=Streptomyces sp. SLBN-118 TaxID=2768454 RepID=UPI00164288C4|nr:DUF5959 family protein [Streptomyces sp. SLBN-118]